MGVGAGQGKRKIDKNEVSGELPQRKPQPDPTREIRVYTASESFPTRRKRAVD